MKIPTPAEITEEMTYIGFGLRTIAEQGARAMASAIRDALREEAKELRSCDYDRINDRLYAHAKADGLYLFSDAIDQALGTSEQEKP
jgi:hypothetical protein